MIEIKYIRVTSNQIFGGNVRILFIITNNSILKTSNIAHLYDNSDVRLTSKVLKLKDKTFLILWDSRTVNIA